MKYSTDTEKYRSMKRELIARRLMDGQSYDQIAHDLETSTRTIAEISKHLWEYREEEDWSC